LVKPAKEVLKNTLKKEIKVEVKEGNQQKQAIVNKPAGHVH
jgi:hypothetical protein